MSGAANGGRGQAEDAGEHHGTESRGRAHTDVIGYPTNPGQQGQYIYLYGPGLRTDT